MTLASALGHQDPGTQGFRDPGLGLCQWGVPHSKTVKLGISNGETEKNNELGEYIPKRGKRHENCFQKFHFPWQTIMRVSLKFFTLCMAQKSIN
jgi:hypothetical protein